MRLHKIRDNDNISGIIYVWYPSPCVKRYFKHKNILKAKKPKFGKEGNSELCKRTGI